MVEAPAITIIITANGTRPPETPVAGKGLRTVRLLNADDNLILPERRSRQEHYEEGISPEVTPMTKGGSLAASDEQDF